MVKKSLLLFSIIFFCLISLNFVSAATNVSVCGNITSAGIYELNTSLQAGAGLPCLTINVSDVVLDCLNYSNSITGDLTSNGFGVGALGSQTLTNVTVKNCNITGFDMGVWFNNTNNSLIFNNTFYNDSTGIDLSFTLDINVSTNNITTFDSNASAIFLMEDNSSVIENNIMTTDNVSANGINMDSSVDTIANLNTITTSGTNSSGIALEGSAISVNLTTNTITTSGVGAMGIQLLDSSSSCLLFNNVITTSENESFGIFLDGANNMNISSNNITTSSYHGDGINLQGTNDSVLTQNIIQTGDPDACVIQIEMSGYNNTIYDNIFNTSSNRSGACLNDSLANIWNTTEAVSTNIMGGPNLGGNFWTNNASTGYSDICIDSDGDYICDNPYNLTDAGNNIDYLPLANHTNMVSACDTLNVENKYYALNQSITGITATCFNITANNITLNFAGFNMTGDGTGAGVNITGYNSTTVLNGSVYNFSNGIYISSGSNNTFTNININDSKQDAIFLTGATSDNNNFTNIIVTNTNSSCYDIKFGTAGINGTWIININFANYTFTGAGGLVNFKEPSFGEIKFLQAINGSGTNLSIDVDIESNSVFVNASSNSGLNKSADISFYSVSFRDPKPQYSSDGATFTDCTTTTIPACSEVSYSGNTFIFNTSHFTYFKAVEAYSAPGGGGGGSSPSLTQTISLTTTEQTYTRLGNYNKLEFELGGNTHLLTIKKVYSDRTKVDFIIESNPTYFTLKIGESKTIDIGESESLYVKLVSIKSSRADIIVKKIIKKQPLQTIILPKKEEIKEEVLEEVPAIEEEIVSQLPEEERKPTIGLLIISLVSLIIIITLVTYFIILKKKKFPF